MSSSLCSFEFGLFCVFFALLLFTLTSLHSGLLISTFHCNVKFKTHIVLTNDTIVCFFSWHGDSLRGNVMEEILNASLGHLTNLLDTLTKDGYCTGCHGEYAQVAQLLKSLCFLATNQESVAHFLLTKQWLMILMRTARIAAGLGK